MIKLITMSLSCGDVSYMLRIPKEFLMPQEARIIEFVRDYILHYGSPPTLSRVESEFKFFYPSTSPDPLGDLFDRAMVMRKNEHFIRQVTSHKTELESGGDPTEMVEQMAKLFSKEDSSAYSTQGFDRTQYFVTKRLHEFGISFIDESAGGIADGDYVLIVGRPGSHKTTFMEWIMSQWLLCGMNILYISNENSALESMQKIDAFLGGWNPLRLRDGKWTQIDNAHVISTNWVTSKLASSVIIPDSPALTPQSVISYANSYNIDAIFVDGIYLMSMTGAGTISWEEAAGASRGLKRFARSSGIPITGTIQATREAEAGLVGRGTIAYTDAYLQDADTIVTLNKMNHGVVGQVIKSRWGPTLLSKSFELIVDYKTMWVCTKQEAVTMVTDGEW